MQQGPADSSTQASNQTHRHFIDILRETLQILRPLSRQTTNIKVEKDIDDTATNIGNRFQYLEVDDPTEWTSNALPSSKSAKIVTTNTYDLEPTDEDISFAIFCLLKDLTDIRHYVRQTVSI